LITIIIPSDQRSDWNCHESDMVRLDCNKCSHAHVINDCQRTWS